VTTTILTQFYGAEIFIELLAMNGWLVMMRATKLWVNLSIKVKLIFQTVNRRQKKIIEKTIKHSKRKA
jgi:hypothetical protein